MNTMENESRQDRTVVYYGMYILAMLIFGTNGYLVAHISLQSSHIVLVRTLIGGLILTILVLMRGGFDREAVKTEKTDLLLKPLQFRPACYLKEDLPEILKYKGKTSASFTRMMINICRSLLPEDQSGKTLTLLDPMCGKGTSCFCALVAGMNAVGLDIDAKDIREASEYFSRYLKINQMKHTVKTRSETAGKTAVPVTEFVFADTKEHYQSGDTRSLMLATGDTCVASGLARKKPAHLLVADLPYGIQHAPQSGRKPEPFTRILERSLPEWRKALVPGGTAALSFNTLTLPADTVVSLLEKSGFAPLRDEWYSGFRHEVEQAVVRDVVFARKIP